MISMQRSLSQQPVAIHSSPPLSPVATPASRSSTPSALDSHVEVSHSRQFRARSPTHSNRDRDRDSMMASIRRNDDHSRSHSRRSSVQQMPSPPMTRVKPIIDQAPTPPPVAMPAPNDSSDSLDTIGSPPSLLPEDKHGKMNFLRPLLTDVSMYTQPYLSPESEGTTLEELAHLVRLSKYQERKRANTRVRLQRSLVSTALSARLMRCGEIAHRNLVDTFRADDKKTFAALYNAIIDVRKSCDETRRYALLESEMELLQSPPGLTSTESVDTPTGSVAGTGAAPGTISPFFNELSASTRETFLSFLNQIRNNPDYLATRITSLNSVELAALTSFHQGLEPIESVLPYHSQRSIGRSAGAKLTGSGATGNSNQERTAIERLLSFQRHDPISALIYTCFANSAGPDSAEDKRRTTIWANACARLITNQTTGSEQTITSVLNVWVSMRDWSGKSNMEWYLMKILEDGAFLLDRAEDQHGTRFNVSDWSSKDQIAAEEFYTRAVDELFEVLDDEDATGIPEGLLELGNEILKRLDKKTADSTRRWLVAKYLFTVWLLGVIIHPESYGMMGEYHITEYARQKILKAVAMHAQKLVIDMLLSNTPVSTPPKVKGHVENIKNRFRESKYRKKPRLLPARSITSLRETAEVHPYLVISPADLATLVHALFPERRPQSSHSGSLRSGAPSVSGFSAISQPMSMSARTAPSTYDTMSVLSTSAESVVSDTTTSREPLLEDGSPRRYSPPIQDSASQKPTTYEEDGYRLRMALHEMNQTLGPEVVNGLCHPCAERWAVLFISADGNQLSTHMTYDPDEEPEEESSSTSDTEDEETGDERPELNKDYHQLRDSILKLVQDYEIPQHLETDGSKKTFSNRASSLKKYRAKNRAIITMGSRNPYRQRAASIASSLADSPPNSYNGKDSAEPDLSSPLVAMLTAASSQSRAQSDFVSAHLYWRTLQQLNTVTSESLRRNGYSTLLNIFSRGPRDSIRRSAAAIEQYDAWLVWLKQSQERAEGLIDTMMRRLRALRDKMWYVTDVRNSAPYEDSRNVAVALKTMGMPRRWNSFQKKRNQMQRGPASNFLLRTESQILDLLAASEEQGGPNKLRDDQAEKATRWLQQYEIENFCRGEERIHRFCCEVDSCINKLVGDSIVDGPVLWSSELYARDRRTFETPKAPSKDRDNQSVWDDSVSVVSDPERRFNSLGRAAGAGVLRALSANNMSQASFDTSSRFSYSRASTVAMSEVLDGPDYFGASSPVHQIDPQATFWSPFHHRPTSPSNATSRAHSPTTSVTNFSGSFNPPNHQQLPSHAAHSIGRGAASTASSNETVFQQRQSEEKARFLGELRQTLTSLLLSDLGNLVYARGSETDAWFEKWGQDCIDRRSEIQRRARNAKAKERPRSGKFKIRGLDKRKNLDDLHSNDGRSEKAFSDTQSVGGGSVHGNESAATNDTVSTQKQKESRKEPFPEFPFTKAYRRLLKMFCVHPNPYVKMNALSELEHLITASLNSGSRRTRLAWARSDIGSASSATDEVGGVSGTSRPPPIDVAIDNIKERRSHTFNQGPIFGSDSHSRGGRVSGGGGNAETRSVISVHPTNTDAITNILLKLFRDPSLRPKTLFRDLQFIAAFVPPTLLDKTERGKAFWDAGLAALSLKQEVCRTMVEVADDIVKNYTQMRSGGAPAGTPGNGSSASDQSPPSSPPSPLPLSTHSLADAATMWTITAKEGDPTAQRELALFYLSNPELVDRTTVPLSKPREVFKQAVMEKYGGGRGGGGPGSSRYHHPGMGGSGQSRMGQGGLSLGVGGSGSGGSGVEKESTGGAFSDVRSNPELMCLAIHWMEAAEQGGDELARTFMAQNEMGAGLMG